MPGRLQFQGKHAPSLLEKSAILAALSIGTLAAGWLMYAGPETYRLRGDPIRQAVLLAFAVIYIVRIAISLLVFLRRKIPWWEAAYGGGLLSAVVFFFAYRGGNNVQPLQAVDGLGILLYVAGSYLGTRSEYSRHLWKWQPENRGHLYTQGLFHFARHINYFGDLLLFSGFAILTGHLGMLIAPAAMALNFGLLVIPAHDAYLADRYGPEFEEYARRTKRLIPLIY